MPCFKGDNKMLITFKISLQISIKHGTKYPEVKGIQVCSNEGLIKGKATPFLTGENNDF